ncbi:MAG TPA: hypothetical protein ENH23_06400 [candidate division Zixibacteria bacterium]|nr:hypothetical protein [candidate division Zixibacteria bacterium]
MPKKKHILILGCPAVGKLTTAKALSRQLDYPVFDNAKIVDLVSLIHLNGTKEFRVYRDYLRRSFYTEALSNSNIIGLISTNVLRHPDNWKYFESIEDLFDKSGWVSEYILLTASSDVLLKRVVSESRKSKTTINTEEQLLNWLRINPLCNSIENHGCHVIDTTNLDAEKTANKINCVLELNHGS